MKNENESGQIALIVVMILVVMSTIVLSVVSRSISELNLARVEESSTQALKAAEGGIEEALRNLSIGSSIEGTVNNVDFTTTTSVAGSDGLVTIDAIEQGEIVEVLLEGAVSPPTSLDVYWGDISNTTEVPVGAIEVIKYQKWSATDYRVVHLAYDVNATRLSDNNFTTGVGSPGTFKGVNFSAKASVPVVAQDILIRIRVFYNQAKIGIAPLPGGSTLPDQVYRVVSTGVSNDGVSRRVEAQRTLPVLPPQFDAALYSGTTLSQ